MNTIKVIQSFTFSQKVEMTWHVLNAIAALYLAMQSGIALMKLLHF